MKYKKLKKADKGIYNINPTKLAKDMDGAQKDLGHLEQVNTFGTPNWNNIFMSQAVLGALGYLGNHNPNSFQNATLQYNQQHNSALNQAQYTPNVSQQDQYGRMDEGGAVDPSDPMSDPDYDFLFSPEQASLAEQSAQTSPKKSKTAPQEEADDQEQQQVPFVANTNSLITAISEPSKHRASGNVNLEGIDPDVMRATQQMLQHFPQLTITSGRRNWGDKDAHPLGRAIDLAGPGLQDAWDYYNKNIVPQYHFEAALNPNHGTGPHIHVGHYAEGGPGPINRGDTPSYYGLHAPVMRPQPNYGSSMSPSQQALQQAQSWIPTANALNQQWASHERMYNAIFNQAKQEGWSDQKMKDALSAQLLPINHKIDSLQALMPAQYGKGGIHIKKSHEGRFTAYKKQHHMTTEEALHSKNPHVRQMANFARNAKKWHHAEGGEVDPKPKPTVYKTQAEVDAANMQAKEFGARHPYSSTLINPEDNWVARKPGDPVVQYETIGTPSKGPKLYKAMDIPSYVKADDIQTDGNNFYWYVDPQQGNSIAVDPSVVNTPRFRKQKADGGTIYSVGQEYDLPEEEIARLKSLGYEFE